MEMFVLPIDMASIRWSLFPDASASAEKRSCFSGCSLIAARLFWAVGGSNVGLGRDGMELKTYPEKE